MNDAGDGKSFTWRSWPMRDRAKTILPVLAVCAAALGSVYVFTDEAFWVPVGALILALGLRDYFLPVTYTLDEQGIAIRNLFWTRRRPWADIRRVIPSIHGVFLSPFDGPSRLENFRGLYLRFASNRDEVLAAVERFTSGAITDIASGQDASPTDQALGQDAQASGQDAPPTDKGASS